MRNKILIGCAILVIVGAGLLLTATQRQTPPTSAEDLIKKSAKEMVDPVGQAMKQAELASTSLAPKNSIAITEIPKICEGEDSQKFDCYEKYYDNLTSTKGVKAAFDDLKLRYPKNGYIQSQCHPITHVIGNSAALIYPDVGVAYSKGDSFCWSGYYHGIMEGVVENSSIEEVAKGINKICDSVDGKDRYSFDYYNCVHGLGHGVMASNQNELFDSLKFCDNLIGEWERSSCWGGVFMENIIVDNKNRFTKYLRPSEPLYPCSGVEDKYKGTCYLMQTSYMLKVTGGDFVKVFDLCEEAGVDFRVLCFNSLGRDASGRSLSNATTTKQTCDLGKNFEQRSNCIVGAVKDFISYFHSDSEANNLCRLVDTDLKEVCSSTTKSYYKSL